MIPIGDSVRSRTFPYVNLTIIAICVIVFLYELSLSTTASDTLPGLGIVSKADLFFFDWGTLPACFADRFGIEPERSQLELDTVCPEGGRLYLTPFTAMFIHAGWLHLIGNMIFLWVFGDNVEDAMGHIRYAVFYALAGVAATAAHLAVNVNDIIPAIGASGAISGVLAAYLVLYPRATVAAVLPIFILVFMPFYVPAVFLIGFWFVLQLFNGVADIVTRDVAGGGGGVAWFAHIGGFVAGLVLVKLFVLGRQVRPAAPARYRFRRRAGW